IDYEEDYQGEIQGNAQEDKLTIAMILLARAITQRYSNPTNNHLRTSSNTRNQVVIQDGRVDIQSKEQMLLAMKDEARGNINEEESDFMLDNTYGDDTFKELLATVIMMARIKPTKNKDDAKPKHDTETISKKAIAAKPKMYDGERLQRTKLIIDSPDYEETLEDTKES
nr:hypothetical protein [Tanacetum cinerariifolium]